MIITVLLTLGTAAVTMTTKAQARQLEEKSHIDTFVNAYSPSGKVRVDLREVRTEIMGAKGPIALSVLVMRDPSSGAYSWRAHTADPTDPSWRSQQLNDDQAVFLKDGEFTDFMSLSIPLRLFIHQYHGHATDMNDAVTKALKAASESIDPLGDLEKVPGMHVISLLALGRDFTSAFPSNLDIDPKVVNAQWDGDKQQWIVTLRARWAEEITLDADYNLVSMRKVE
jgi:hypothetical protein